MKTGKQLEKKKKNENEEVKEETVGTTSRGEKNEELSFDPCVPVHLLQ